MKKYLKLYLRTFVEIIIFTILFTLLSHFNIINNTIYNYLELISILLIIYFNSKSLKTKKDEVIPINNLKFGISIVLIFLFLNIILGNVINLKTIIYFLIIIIISILGNMKKKA